MVSAALAATVQFNSSSASLAGLALARQGAQQDV